MSATIGVTPQMFGAKGDGINNDTNAVQAAINFASSNENKTVFLPGGIYSVRNLVLKKNVSLVGEGENSILKADPSCKTWDGIMYSESGTSISNVVFDGNKPVIPGNTHEGVVLVWIENSSNVTISDCVLQNNWYLGICLKNSKDITIDSNELINIDCGILTASYPSSNITINNNYFDGAEYSEPISIYGMKEGYHENITITNNIIKNHTKGSGIALRAVRKVTVTNNTIDNCCTGIYTYSVTYSDKKYGVYDAVIKNNTITNSVAEGMLLSNLNESEVNDNSIENSGSYGILTREVSRSNIKNNKVSIPSITGKPFHGYAMTLNGLKESVISDNAIITENKYSTDRRPIVIASTSENNVFSSNSFMIDFAEVYRSLGKNNSIQ